MKPSFKEKFAKIRTCSLMNNTRDPQKKNVDARFVAFHRNPTPTLIVRIQSTQTMSFPQFHPLEKRIQSVSFNPPTHASLNQTLSFV